MAILYAISVGYNPSIPKEDVWSKMVEVVNELRINSQKIVDEVLRLEPDADKEMTKSVSEMYSPLTDDEDLNIKVIVSDGKGRHSYIMQSASGGGQWRLVKESCRRAFCRLVLEEMHKNKMEINIDVS